MAVDLAAAMAGQMLDDRRDAGRQETLAGRPAQGGHDLRIGGKGAVADHLMGAGKPEIENRGADRIDAEAASSPAMSRALSRTASAASAGSLAASSPKRPGGGAARQCGGRRRWTRPPS